MFKAFWGACFSVFGLIAAGTAQAQADNGVLATPEIKISNRVLSDGGFRYSIPIEVPEFRGLEPNLDLKYSSSFSGHGTPDAVMGAGWRLSALSSIERVSLGGGIPIYHSDKDIYRLNGQDLLLCNDIAATDKLTRSYPSQRKTDQASASCTAGGHFVTQVENYLKIRRDGNWFQVTRKDGTKLDYRSMGAIRGLNSTPGTTAHRILEHSRYLLAQVQDTSGNVVRYHYNLNHHAEAYAPRLYKITYELPDGTIVYSVRLIYEILEDHVARPTYATGTPLIGNQKLRLSSILVLEGDMETQIRAYQLDYTISEQSKISLLRTVKRYGSDFVFSGGRITGGTQLGKPYR